MIGLQDIIPQAAGANLGIGGSLVFHTTFNILFSPPAADGSAAGFFDITSSFSPIKMISIHYEDHISFTTDNLELICPDPNDAIINNPKVSKGSWLKIQIHMWNREYPGSHVMKDTGSFQIDQIKQTGPMTQTVIMATSCPISSTIKLTLKNVQNLTTDLKTLATDIAKQDGLDLVWDVPSMRNIIVSQAVQWNESDLAMLSRYAKSMALCMSLKPDTSVAPLTSTSAEMVIGSWGDGKPKIIIFDEQIYEQRPAVYTVDFGNKSLFTVLNSKSPGIVHWELTTQSQDIYSLAVFNYFDPNTNQMVQGEASAPTTSGSKEELHAYDYDDALPKTEGETIGAGPSTDTDTNKLGGTVPPVADTDKSSVDNANEYAAAILRAKNIHEHRCLITWGGTLVWPNGKAIEAGTNLAFINKGIFNGKWIIQLVRMTITDNKFVTEVDLRKCIVPRALPAGSTEGPQSSPPSSDSGDPDPDPDPNAPPSTTEPSASTPDGQAEIEKSKEAELPPTQDGQPVDRSMMP